MASSKPPTKAIRPKPRSPRGDTGGGLLSPSSNPDQQSALSSSLALVELIEQSGLILAPATPEPPLVAAAAKRAGIAPKQALEAFLIIAGFGEIDIH